MVRKYSVFVIIIMFISVFAQHTNLATGLKTSQTDQTSDHISTVNKDIYKQYRSSEFSATYKDLTYLSSGQSSVYIYNISVVSDPVFIKSIDQFRQTADILVWNSTLIVIDIVPTAFGGYTKPTVTFFDLSNPGNPMLISTVYLFPNNETERTLQQGQTVIHDDQLLVKVSADFSTSNYDYIIYDLSDLNHPSLSYKLLGSEMDGFTTYHKFYGDRLFERIGQTLRIFNISNIDSPKMLYENLYFGRGGFLGDITPGSNNILYATFSDYIKVYNITNLDNFQLISNIDVSNGNLGAISGDILVNYGGASISSYNISEVNNIVRLGYIDLNVTSLHEIHLPELYRYNLILTQGSLGFSIYDIKTDKPTVKVDFNSYEVKQTLTIGTELFVLSYSSTNDYYRLSKFDISGNTFTPIAEIIIFAAADMMIHVDSWIYLSSFTKVVKVSTEDFSQNNITEVYHGYSIYMIHKLKNNLLISTFEALIVMDLSTGSVLSTINKSGITTRMVTMGDSIIIPYYDNINQLGIINLSDPSNPKVATFTYSINIVAIGVYRDYLYFFDGSTLYFYQQADNKLNLLNSVYLGSLLDIDPNLPFFTYKAYFRNNVLYLMQTDLGIMKFDISTPNNTVLLARSPNELTNRTFVSCEILGDTRLLVIDFPNTIYLFETLPVEGLPLPQDTPFLNLPVSFSSIMMALIMIPIIRFRSKLTRKNQ